MNKTRRLLTILLVLYKRRLPLVLYQEVLRRRFAQADCLCEADPAILEHARRVRLALEDLGPTFVKLGQFLSRRPDLIPPPYARELARLQTAARPISFEDIERALRSHCICGERMRSGGERDPLCLHCNRLEEVFEGFEREPLASASLAQVHRATFRGREVAVKVLRPGILGLISADLDLMWSARRFLTRALGLQGSVDPDAFFAQFRRRLEQEVDLTAEALNIERFRANQRDNPTVTAPEVFWGFNRHDLLVTELLRGVPVLSRVSAGRREPELAHRVEQSYLKQVYIDNFFHADPHPGNIFLLDDGRLAYLDFGAVGSLDTRTRLLAHRLFLATARGDAQGAQRAVMHLSQARLSPSEAQELRLALERVIAQVKISAGMRWTDQLLEIARRLRLPLPEGMVSLARGALLVESLVIQLDPEINLQREMEPFLKDIVRRDVRELLTSVLPDLVEDYVELLTRLPAALGQLLDRYSLEAGSETRRK